MSKAEKKLSLPEGLHVLHLFYSVDHSHWQELSKQSRIAIKTKFTELVAEISSHANTQILSFGMMTPKADLGFMITTKNLYDLHYFEKSIAALLDSDVFCPVYHYLSQTERSEYTTSADRYKQQIMAQKGLAEDSEELAEAMQVFAKHSEQYLQHRLYPQLPNWDVFCFYPMSKRREEKYNWYALPYEERYQIMQGHAKIGRTFAGKIIQLITGSTGLDTDEWGVTLFAKDIFDIKKIVYEMRFDEASSRYAQFGDFYIGIQMSLHELFNRTHLN